MRQAFAGLVLTPDKQGAPSLRVRQDPAPNEGQDGTVGGLWQLKVKTKIYRGSFLRGLAATGRGLGSGLDPWAL